MDVPTEAAPATGPPSQLPADPSLRETVTVRVPGRGPLYMKLRRLTRLKVIVVHCFQPNADGSPGPVEQACINAAHDPTVGLQVQPGWLLVDVNDEDVDHDDFHGTIAKIKEEQATAPRRLTFCRPAADSDVAKIYTETASQRAMHRLRQSSKYAALLGRERLAAAKKMLYSGDGEVQDTEQIHKSRVEAFSDLILEENIDLAALREMTLQGVPEQGGFRPIVWRLLLGYLPPERGRWREFLKEQRALYRTFLKEVVPPEAVAAQAKALMRGGPKDPELYRRGENSLSQEERGTILPEDADDKKKTMWDSYFKDAFLMEEIVKDVVRTYPDLHFYTSGMDSANGTPEALAEVCERFLQSIVDMGSSESHYSALARILFVYAKLNPGIKYVQGMNEVLGTLYYVLARDPLSTDLAPSIADQEQDQEQEQDQGQDQDQEQDQDQDQEQAKQRQNGAGEGKATRKDGGRAGTKPELGLGRQSWVFSVEADAFFCFSMLMAEVRDLFTHQLDSSEQGIIGKMETLGKVLHRVDPVLAKHLLENLHLETSLYSLRWFTTLLCREFPLPDTIRLWDGLFSEDPVRRMDAVCYLCTAMVVMQREQLLEGDFVVCLRILQSYPPTNVEDLIDLSERLKEKDRRILRRRIQQSRMNENIAKSLTTAEKFFFGDELQSQSGKDPEEGTSVDGAASDVSRQELESSANADIRAEIAEGFRAGFQNFMTAVRRTNQPPEEEASQAVGETIIDFREHPVDVKGMQGKGERVRVTLTPVEAAAATQAGAMPYSDPAASQVPIEEYNGAASPATSEPLVVDDAQRDRGEGDVVAG